MQRNQKRPRHLPKSFIPMRKMGLEPTRLYRHKILSLACLPIPALPLTAYYTVMQEKGLEPSRYCYHMDLNHARLPFRHSCANYILIVILHLVKKNLCKLTFVFRAVDTYRPDTCTIIYDFSQKCKCFFEFLQKNYIIPKISTKSLPLNQHIIVLNDAIHQATGC